MLPKGSTIEAVINPAPRSVSGSYSTAPISITFLRVAATSSTCQYTISPPGPATAFLGAYLLSTMPSRAGSHLCEILYTLGDSNLDVQNMALCPAGLSTMSSQPLCPQRKN